MNKRKSNKPNKQNKKQLFYGWKLTTSIVAKILKPTVDIISHKDGTIRTATNLSNKDLDILLELTKYQNNAGVINEIYYDRFCAKLNMPYSTFYHCLEHLEERNYIRTTPLGKGCWRITIVDNYYITTDDFANKPYVNMNKKFLFSNEFKALKLNAKKICLYLLTQPTINNLINFNIHLKTIKYIIGIKTEIVVKKYLESIEQFFPNIFKKSKGDKIKSVIFKPAEVVDDRNTLSEKEVFVKHIVQAVCRRFNILFDNFNDLMVVINQYTYKIKFNKLISSVKDTIIKYHEINPKLINVILKST